MTRFSRICGQALAGLLCCLAAPGAEQPTTVPALTGFPFTNETLHYTLSWPSGLSLGEAHEGHAQFGGNGASTCT